MKSKRKWVSWLTAAALSTTIAVLAAEICLRLYEHWFLSTELPVPGETGTVDLSRLNYNETKVDREKGPGEYRILSFGDSFCYSIMKPELSYSGIMQTWLNDHHDSTRFRVVNLGEPSTSVNDYQAAYRYWSTIFEHDAVLFNIYLGNDIINIAYQHIKDEWSVNRVFGKINCNIADGRWRTVPKRFPLRMLDFIYFNTLAQVEFQDRELPGPDYNLASRDNLPDDLFRRAAAIQLDNFDPAKLESLRSGYQAAEQLLKFASELRQQGKQVMISLAPNEAQVNGAFRADVASAYDIDLSQLDLKLSARIIETLRDRIDPKLQTLDLVEYFQSEYDYHEGRVNLYFKTNTHWGPEGNVLAGKVIAASMLELWFNRPDAMPTEIADRRAAQVASYVPRVSRQAIVDYLDQAPQPFAGITGVLRPDMLWDGVVGVADNFATAPLDEPMCFVLNAPARYQALHLYLYDLDGRVYRFRVEIKSDGRWRKVFESGGQGDRGKVRVPLPEVPLQAFRVTGLYNSNTETNPLNRVLHVMELKLE